MTQSYRRGRLILLGLALAVVALIGVACAPSAAPTPLSTPGGSQAAPAATQPPANATAAIAAPEVDVQMGVDADGNFYKGDPNAAVKLTEYSDFQ